jgi:transcription factor IIIB subunit 2
LKLIKFLHFEMPVIDPSLFIHRFCAKLEFGEKLSQVSMTALRLLQRMKRDWMCHGRRPTGLVGAAILIAARYHGFKRTTNQIVQTVHVCDETIRKRLVEFKQTSVAKLTREEFEKLDLEKDIKEECDPPAFRRANRMKEILKITNYEKEMEKKGKMIEFKIDGEEESAKPVENDAEKAKRQEEEEEKDKNLSEIDEDDIEQYILTHEESALKSIIWHHIHKEWLEEQEIKEKKKNLKSTSGVRRKKKTRELVDAPDAVSAILNHSKIGNKLNSNALNRLFNDPVKKRLKIENSKLEEGTFKQEEPTGLGLGSRSYSRGIRIQVG